MAYDFPDSPTLGQVYDKWTWNGEAWVLTPVPPPVLGYDKAEADARFVNVTGDNMSGQLSITKPTPGGGEDFFRINNSKYGLIYHANNSDFYMMVTNADDPLGSWNSLHPFRLNYESGDITINRNLSVNDVLRVGTAIVSSGYMLAYNLGSPTTGTLYLGNTYTRYLTYDGAQYVFANAHVHSAAGRLWGSADFNYTPAAPLGYTPVNRAGDTMTGRLAVNNFVHGWPFGVKTEANINVGLFPGGDASVHFGAINDAGTSWLPIYVHSPFTVGAPLAVSGALSVTGVSTLSGGWYTTCLNTTLDYAGSSNVEVTGAGGGAEAFMTFHRPGAYAVNFGLTADNNLRWGGYSLGAARYLLWSEKHTGWPLSNGRLPHAGDRDTTPDIGFVDVVANAVLSGYRSASGANGPDVNGFRTRYVQGFSSAWFTFAYA